MFRMGSARPEKRVADAGTDLSGYATQEHDRSGNHGPGGCGSGPIASDGPAIPMDKLSFQRKPDFAARTFLLHDDSGPDTEVHAPGCRGRWLRYRDMGRPRSAEPGVEAEHYGAGQ